MRTKKLNVFEEQQKWMMKHRKADRLVCNKSGMVEQAIYFSPLEQWKGLVAPDGTVNVPDMDFYNTLQGVGEIVKVVEELSELLEP